MRRATPIPAAAFLLLILGSASGAEAALTVEPAEIPIGLFFHGGEVRARASHGGADHVVFRLLGPEREFRLNVMGRVGGILWAKVAEVRLEHVPSVLLVRAGPDLPPAERLDRAGLTPESLRGTILGSKPTETESHAFDEMLGLLEDEGVWAVRPGATLAPEGDAETVFEIPAEVPAGEYDLSVTFFAGDRVIATDHAALTVRRTGAVSTITDLAEHRALTYGLIAILVAVLAGLATGYVFGLGKKRKR